MEIDGDDRPTWAEKDVASITADGVVVAMGADASGALLSALRRCPTARAAASF
jgi:hypothetical protein